MNSSTLNIALIGAFALGGLYIFRATGQPPAAAGPAIVAPSSSKLSAIKAALSSAPAKAAKLAAFYRDFAAVVRTVKGLRSLGSFRDSHKAALEALIAGLGGLPGPAIGVDVDAYLAEVVGLEDVPLDDATRNKLADALAQLSKALGE